MSERSRLVVWWVWIICGAGLMLINKPSTTPYLIGLLMEITVFLWASLSFRRKK